MGADLATGAVKTAGSLFLVLGLIVCLFYVIKRMRFGAPSAAGAARMRLLGTLHLAPKRSVALVEIRDQWLVLGLGTESVTLLSSMTRPEEVERPDPEKASGATSFRALLRGRMHRMSEQDE
ncbi:MAG: flagellar biosynthetic protein FliO [Desulfobacteraceae bacterium]|jgi:flagellar biosynthetic protein FliO